MFTFKNTSNNILNYPKISLLITPTIDLSKIMNNAGVRSAGTDEFQTFMHKNDLSFFNTTVCGHTEFSRKKHKYICKQEHYWDASHCVSSVTDNI